jgi:hypothetical protein
VRAGFGGGAMGCGRVEGWQGRSPMACVHSPIMARHQLEMARHRQEMARHHHLKRCARACLTTRLAVSRAPGSVAGRRNAEGPGFKMRAGCRLGRVPVQNGCAAHAAYTPGPPPPPTHRAARPAAAAGAAAPASSPPAPPARRRRAAGWRRAAGHLGRGGGGEGLRKQSFIQVALTLNPKP